MIGEGRLEHTFTGPSESSDTLVIDKSFNLSIQGSFSGALVLERKPVGSDLAFDFKPVRTITGEFEGIDSQGGEPFEYRVSSNGAFSGTALVRLSRSTLGGNGGNIFERGGGAATASSVTVTNEVEVKNDAGNPLPALIRNQMLTVAFDYIGLTYNVNDDVTAMVFKQGGASGTVVMTLTFTLGGADGDRVDAITRT